MPAELWTDIPFWALAIIGVFLTGISKSGFAGGAGVVAVPLLALVAPPALAIIVMLPLLLLMDAQIIVQQRKNLSVTELKIVIPAALIGVALGTFVLNGLADAPLQLLLGVLSLVFAAIHWFKPSMQSHSGLGWLMGSIAGVTSTLIHAGGPPLNMYLATRQLSRAVWISTAAMFFASINFAKIFAYAAIDLWQFDLFMISLYLIPASIVGIIVGHKIQAVISEQAFVKAIMLCLAASGLMLIFKAALS